MCTKLVPKRIVFTSIYSNLDNPIPTTSQDSPITAYKQEPPAKGLKVHQKLRPKSTTPKRIRSARGFPRRAVPATPIHETSAPAEAKPHNSSSAKDVRSFPCNLSVKSCSNEPGADRSGIARTAEAPEIAPCCRDLVDFGNEKGRRRRRTRRAFFFSGCCCGEPVKQVVAESTQLHQRRSRSSRNNATATQTPSTRN